MTGLPRGALVAPPILSVRSEYERAREIFTRLGGEESIRLVEERDTPGADETLRLLVPGSELLPAGEAPKQVGWLPDASRRMRRQFDRIVDYNRNLVRRFAAATG